MGKFLRTSGVMIEYAVILLMYSQGRGSVMSRFTMFLLVASAVVGVCTPCVAQSFGEQRAVQFKYSGQGLTTEVYRRQLGAAASSVGSGSLGTSESGSALNNAIQTSSTLNITVSGSSNTLNVSGDNVSGDQRSSDTAQTNTNAQTTTSYLNR